MLVRDMMRREVATIGPQASLATAARRMREHGVGCLPVLADGRLIGMLTDRDIVVRGVAEGLDPDRAVVRDVMSAAPVSCPDDQTTEAAQEIMAANRIKHLPVLDRRDALVGVIALRDLSGQFAKGRPHEVTFYKRLASSAGRVSNVTVGKVYLHAAVPRDEVVAAAIAKFEQDHGVARWDQAADGYELEEDGQG